MHPIVYTRPQKLSSLMHDTANFLYLFCSCDCITRLTVKMSISCSTFKCEYLITTANASNPIKVANECAFLCIYAIKFHLNKIFNYAQICTLKIYESFRVIFRWLIFKFVYFVNQRFYLFFLHTQRKESCWYRLIFTWDMIRNGHVGNLSSIEQ